MFRLWASGPRKARMPKQSQGEIKCFFCDEEGHIDIVCQNRHSKAKKGILLKMAAVINVRQFGNNENLSMINGVPAKFLRDSGLTMTCEARFCTGNSVPGLHSNDQVD